MLALLQMKRKGVVMKAKDGGVLRGGTVARPLQMKAGGGGEKTGRAGNTPDFPFCLH